MCVVRGRICLQADLLQLDLDAKNRNSILVVSEPRICDASLAVVVTARGCGGDAAQEMTCRDLRLDKTDAPQGFHLHFMVVVRRAQIEMSELLKDRRDNQPIFST